MELENRLFTPDVILLTRDIGYAKDHDFALRFEIYGYRFTLCHDRDGHYRATNIEPIHPEDTGLVSLELSNCRSRWTRQKVTVKTYGKYLDLASARGFQIELNEAIKAAETIVEIAHNYGVDLAIED